MAADCSPATRKRELDTPCPRCGRKGKRVSLTTVGAMAKIELEAVKLSAREYQLCRTPDCEIVYYSLSIWLEKNDLRVPVHFKERNYEGPICYCFNHTVASIRQEIRAQGRSTAQSSITREVKAGHCACEVKNPAGTCCLGDISRAVQAARAVLAQ